MKPYPPNQQAPVDDSQLVSLTRAGDLNAFEQLVRRYQNPLICFLRFHAFGSQDVEDVAQEAFLQCYLHLDQFDATRSFKPWLYTIARRIIPRLSKARCLPLPHPDSLPDENNQPGGHSEELEERESLWKQIRAVTNDIEFQLIWLRYAERLSIAETAEILEQTPAACKMRLSRLRNRLRVHLTAPHNLSDQESNPTRNLRRAA